MKKKRKQAAVASLNLTLNGGLNYAQSVANIADNELARAMNFVYDPETDQLMARAGTTCETAAALTDPITAAYYYVKNDTTAYHIAASGDQLYKLDGTAYTAIGTIVSGSTPSFVTFNGKLIIADGGSTLSSWDGTTYTAIANSPKADALAVIGNRIVANHVDEDDSVYLSKTNDETDWDTTGSAIGLKAGFGDLLRVNAFGVYGTDLVISKNGDAAKRLYRLNVASATTSEWQINALSFNNAAQNSQCMLGAWNNIFFVDSNGFKSLRGVQEYGDLQVDFVGNKINKVFGKSTVCDFVSYLPSYNSIWFNVGERMFAYTERIDHSTGQKVPAFTDMYFQWGRARMAYEAEDEVYLVGHNGYLYKMDDTYAADETVPGTTKSYICAVRTKTFSSFNDQVLRKIQWYLKPKNAGTGTLNLCYTENDKTVLKNFNIESDGDLLHDATGLLNSASGFIYDSGVSPWTEETRNRYRGTDMAFEIQIDTGRCGVEWCKAEVATLEGGE